MDIVYYWSKIFKKIRGSSIKNSSIHKSSKIESGSNIVNVTMEKYSFCGYNCEIANTHIGSFCSIANGVIIGGGMHPIQWVSTSPVFYKGRDSVKAKFSEFEREPIKTTYIGNDVWIGQNVLIKQGVNIGHGSVIGMGSIVTKDIEPYTICAGNPARVIRKRFDDKIIKELLNTCWWNMNDNELKKCAKYIKEPENFIKCIKKCKVGD